MNNISLLLKGAQGLWYAPYGRSTEASSDAALQSLGRWPLRPQQRLAKPGRDTLARMFCARQCWDHLVAQLSATKIATSDRKS